MIELRILGGLELVSSRNEICTALLAQPKRLALLTYLTLNSSRGWVSRETLMGVFWPELDTSHARAALRKAVHFLRQEMGAEAVLSQGSEYLRVPPEAVPCDAVEFEERIVATELEAALPLYRGELLPGLYVSECPEFEQWLDMERQRMRSHARRAALRLSRTAAADSTDLALFWARRAEMIAPQDEEVIREIMGLLARGGNTGQARRAFETFADRLRRQWEMEPSPETREMARSLSREQVSVAFSGIHPPADAAAPTTDSLYHDIVESAPDLIYRADVSGHFTYVNEAAARTAGYSRAEMIGRFYLDLIPEDYRDTVLNFYLRQVEERIPLTYHECPAVARDGREYWLAQKAQLLVRGDEVLGLQVVARDITVRRRAEQTHRSHSLFDADTGLYNRRACALLLEQKIRLAVRNQRSFPLVQAVVGCGPGLVSPSVAAAIAELFRDAFRASDVLGRLDGSTFLMLPDEWGPEEVGVLLSRLESGLAALRVRGDIPEELEVDLSEQRFDPVRPRSADALLDAAASSRLLPA